jgi:hypothetical protein
MAILTTRSFHLGASSRALNHPMSSLPFFDPSQYETFFDDFYDFPTAAASVYGWRKDEVNTGALDPTVQDLAGGVIKFTIDNADNDNAHFQYALNTTVISPFILAAGKRAWLRVKFKTEDADTDIPIIGLHTAADDPWGTEPADQFLFRTLRADPDALEFAVGTTNATEVTVSLGDLADDTFCIVGAFYDGADTVHVWRESPTTGLITNSGTATVTSSVTGDLLPNGAMTVAFGMEATDTGADDMFVDYILACCERVA